MKTRIMFGFMWLVIAGWGIAAESEEMQIGWFFIEAPSLSVYRLDEQRVARYKEGLRARGVEWPNGSSIQYDQNVWVISNTLENLTKIGSLFAQGWDLPHQVEIQLEIIEYPKDAIEALARDDNLTSPALIALWKEGSGHLKHVPRIVTRTGQEANVRGVTEVIYPTQFHPTSSAATNAAPSSADANLIVPDSFQTREVGVIFSILPEVNPQQKHMINLTLRPETTDFPSWRKYGRHETAAESAACAIMEQPFFHTQTVSTQISLADGARVLLGGGMPTKEGDGIVFMFITARLIDVEGNSMRIRMEK